MTSGLFLLSRLDVDTSIASPTSTWSCSASARLRDAGAGPRRPERRRLRGPRRRHVGRDAVPLDGRHDRGGDLRSDLREPAERRTSPTPSRAASGGGDGSFQGSPAEFIAKLPPAIHQPFITAYADSLQRRLPNRLRRGGGGVRADVVPARGAAAPVRHLGWDRRVVRRPEGRQLAARTGGQGGGPGEAREPPRGLRGARRPRRRDPHTRRDLDAAPRR